MIGVGIFWMIGIAAFTALFGMLLKFIIENWLAEREACIAAFSATLGGIPGSLLFDFSFDYVSVTSQLGSIAGLVSLWWMLFRRRKPAA